MGSIYPIVITAIFVLETILVFGTDTVPNTPVEESLSPSSDVLQKCAEVNIKLNFTESVLKSCVTCVTSFYDDKNSTVGCLFFETSLMKPNYLCGTASETAEGTNSQTDSVTECGKKYQPKPTDKPTSPPTPVTLPSTSPETPTASNTSSTTEEPPAPVLSSTVTPAANGTNTTVAPAAGTSTTPSSPESASGGSFSFANFLGGIVFTLAVSSLAYVVWKFYKARTERNYHTF